MRVREKPPLRTTTLVTAPSGGTFRWGQDEPNPANVPQDERWSSTIPGGWESYDAKLRRKPGVDYSDLVPLSTLTIEGAGGRCAGEYRLERTPRVSGDDAAVSTSAVGWQAALNDDQAAREAYVDIDLAHWGELSVQERLNVIALGFAPSGATVSPDPTTGQPSLMLEAVGAWGATGRPSPVGAYDAGAGVRIGSLYFAWKKTANVDPSDAHWQWLTYLSTDDVLSSYDTSGNLRAAGPGSGTLSATEGRRFAFVQLLYDIAAGADGEKYDIFWTCLAVYGDHGLPLYGVADATNAQGVLASDVVKHAVRKYAPVIGVRDENIDASSFVIPHLATWDAPATTSEIVKQAIRFELLDWAVWEGPHLHLNARGADGTNWRARIRPARLEETGPQVDRVWNSITVQYNDVTGKPRTVGPPGSGAETESSDLLDPDPENPATKRGLTRRDLLTMGTSTPSGATAVGKRFLEQAKLLDTSGRAQLTGWVEDDRGVTHPYWAVRAGDSVTFVDAHDTSPRRVVKADNTKADATCSVDLDSPPEGLQGLLEELSVGLVPLGLS